MNQRFRRAFCAVFAAVFAVGFASPAAAQVVADRATLLTLLGPGAVTEDFEAFSIANGTSNSSGPMLLDASTVFDGQGPGLVIPGFSLATTTASLQWDGQAYYGLPSKAVTPNGAPGVIDFSPAVTAFGVDFLEYSGYPETTTVTVYGPDLVTVLYTSSPISVPGPSPVFFGYQAAGGIGRVQFTATSHSWAPIVDNLTFAGAAAATPTITAITPSWGPVAGGITVTITGTNLASPISVTFGGVAATVTGSTATSITVTLPPHALGMVDVVVTTAGGSATRTSGFLYQDASVVPTLSGGILGLLAAALAVAGVLKLRG